jgi:hypothetical protein
MRIPLKDGEVGRTGKNRDPMSCEVQSANQWCGENKITQMILSNDENIPTHDLLKVAFLALMSLSISTATSSAENAKAMSQKAPSTFP